MYWQFWGRILWSPWDTNSKATVVEDKSKFVLSMDNNTLKWTVRLIFGHIFNFWWNKVEESKQKFLNLFFQISLQRIISMKEKSIEVSMLDRNSFAQDVKFRLKTKINLNYKHPLSICHKVELLCFRILIFSLFMILKFSVLSWEKIIKTRKLRNDICVFPFFYQHLTKYLPQDSLLYYK